MAGRAFARLMTQVRSFVADAREQLELIEEEMTVNADTCTLVRSLLDSFVDGMAGVLDDGGSARLAVEGSQLTMTLTQLEALEESDTNSGLMIAINSGVPGESDVNLAFSDGSVVTQGGYNFASCAVYFGDSSPLNESISLPDVRSSYTAEISGIELALRKSLAAGQTCVVVCLDNSTSLVLALEASRFTFCSSALLQQASRAGPQIRKLVDSIYEVSHQLDFVGYIWVRGHSDGDDFFSLCNDLVDREAQSQSREAAALFFSDTIN